MLGQKLGHQVKSKKNVVYALGHIFCPVLLKVAQNVCLDISLTCLKKGHDG